MDETKKLAKPEDVRTALIPFFSYEGDSRAQLNGVILVTNELPKSIQSLPIFCAHPTTIDVMCRKDRNKLELKVGSGFGHWGIVVLRPGYSEDFSSHPEYIGWGDGVYFYDEYE